MQLWMQKEEMKKTIILLNIISLLSIFFTFANGTSIIGGADGATHLQIPINQIMTIITLILVVFTLVLNLYWITKNHD